MPAAPSKDCELFVSVGLILSKKKKSYHTTQTEVLHQSSCWRVLKRKNTSFIILTRNCEVSSNALIFLQASHNWG